ncbi:MAG: FAD-dependent monooxygenase, partial [Sphingomonadales bacterium]
MPKNIQLTFTPSENADAMLVNQRFCEAAGVNDAAVVWRKRSLDARGKQPFFIITADVYGAGELPPVAQGFLARDVHGAAPVHIIGSGPAGLFAALSLIEQGFKPIVLERGKPVKERRRDLAVLNKE